MAHILVVDDEPEIVRMVAKIMEARGHRISTAKDGQEALDAVAREAPDVIVLDLNLPKLNGFDVCKKLKGEEATRKIPIVMLTAAYISVEDAAHGMASGADEYVVKPFLREVLVHNVERLIPAKTG